jgi:NADH-quinone oxidoreductase subunit G
MALLNIEIDGQATQIESGRTVMDAARQLNITIPHFCYHNKLSIAANCRMCLVQVEKAPKPLPACATPVTEGMKVFTHSEFAVKSQKGVMEFLLINHPLDCPICDQGGECQLQDLAVGYGGSDSRFQEEKRVVANKDLGPLISTDMTRCIHCTRCVRYGEEIAGIMELGMGGRGEHSEIMAFMGQTVDSEVSGNAIDLCPVGALTSKPFRFSARTWELRRSRSISPHCSLGSNLVVQSKAEHVMRVLPGVNEELNECWLSDKDRFSYEALNSEDRATKPMIKRNGQWAESTWQEALEFAVEGLRQALHSASGTDAIAALASPHQTLEELYLLQALVRGLGSGNVDHRLKQTDFRLDSSLQGAPWLGMPVAAVSQLKSSLVIGSSLRKDHPLIAVRLRQAARKGCKVHMIHSANDDLAMPKATSLFVKPSELPNALAQVLVAAAQQIGQALPPSMGIENILVSAEAQAIATSLLHNEHAAVLLGNFAQHHPEFSQLYAMGEELARITQSSFGVIGEAANSVGADIAGAVPGHGPFGQDAVQGKPASDLIAKAREAYLLLGAEPDLDSADGAAAKAAMLSARCVIALTSFTSQVAEYAHVILPIAPFSETAGSFVNTEGRLQSFTAAVKPLGEARPAWKVLRVMANLLELTGFDFEDIEGVRTAMGADLPERARRYAFNPLSEHAKSVLPPVPNGLMPGHYLERFTETPIYRADAIVRRSPSLQARSDGWKASVVMHPDTAKSLHIQAGEIVRVKHLDHSAELPVIEDSGVVMGVARIPAAWTQTSTLGVTSGAVMIERLA